MGYAGYAPAKLPTELTPFQKALKDVKSMESLECIGKLVYKSACMPNEEKYKKVKTTNPKIQSLIMGTPGALGAMQVIGWQEEDEEINCTKTMTMSQFRDIEAAKDNLKKDLRREEVTKLRVAAAEPVSATA